MEKRFQFLVVCKWKEKRAVYFSFLCISCSRYACSSPFFCLLVVQVESWRAWLIGTVHTLHYMKETGVYDWSVLARYWRYFTFAEISRKRTSTNCFMMRWSPMCEAKKREKRGQSWRERKERWSAKVTIPPRPFLTPLLPWSFLYLSAHRKNEERELRDYQEETEKMYKSSSPGNFRVVFSSWIYPNDLAIKFLWL